MIGRCAEEQLPLGVRNRVLGNGRQAAFGLPTPIVAPARRADITPTAFAQSPAFYSFIHGDCGAGRLLQNGSYGDQ
jgi:hypothetical protein